MSDVRRENVMAAELAVLRELAYRRKVTNLQMQPEGDFSTDPLALEVQSSSPSPKPISTSNPTLIGLSQQIASRTLESQPALELQPFQGSHVFENANGIHCKVCQVYCSGPFNYKQHLTGHKHKAKLLALKYASKDSGHESQVEDQRQWCNLCKIWCMDQALFKQHLVGRKHKKEVYKVEHTWKYGNMAMNLPKCVELGNTEEETMELGGKGSIIERGERKWWCEMCTVWCVDEDSLKRHFKGKKHIVQLHEAEERKRAKIEASSLEKKAD